MFIETNRLKLREMTMRKDCFSKCAAMGGARAGSSRKDAYRQRGKEEGRRRGRPGYRFEP